jgi:hypothetical protein
MSALAGPAPTSKNRLAIIQVFRVPGGDPENGEKNSELDFKGCFIAVDVGRVKSSGQNGENKVAH